VTFWCGSGDPYLSLTDPDPTPIFSDFKDAKKKISYFFLKTYPPAHNLWIRIREAQKHWAKGKEFLPWIKTGKKKNPEH
jgi:hypothetical protein